MNDVPPSDTRQQSEDSPSPKIVKRNRLGATFATLLALGLIVSLFPLPFSLFAGLFAIAAIVYAIRYMIAGAGTNGRWLAFGIAGVLVSGYVVLGSLSTAITWPIQSKFQDCTASALTQRASVDCQADYESDVKSWFEKTTGQKYPG